MASAIVGCCEAILRDERSALPVSTLMTGAFGLSDIYLRLPCMLGASGIERVLLPELTAYEIAGLRRSAEVIRQVQARLSPD